MGDLGRETPEQGETRAWLSDGSALGVVAATHEALGLLVPAHAARLGATLAFSLGTARRIVGPLQGRVIALEPDGEGRVLATVRLEQLGPERRRQLAALLLDLPVPGQKAAVSVGLLGLRPITSLEQVTAVLTALATEHQAGLVRLLSEGSYTGTRVRLVDVDPSDDLPLHWQVSGPLPAPPFVVEVSNAEFAYEVLVLRARQESAHVATGLPDELLRLPIARRWLTEVASPTPWRVVLVGRGERPLRRVADERLAFALAPADTFPLGARLKIQLSDGQQQTLTGALAVDTVLPSPTADEQLCVATFEPATQADRDQWHHARERLLYPHTRRAGTWAPSLWELYDKSGYFQLSGKTSAHFTPLRQAFALTTRRLDTAPEIGCQVVWPSRARVEAALSVLMVYSGTALIYQVARRRDEASPMPARQMLREVNLHAFEQLRRDPAFDWTLVYVQEGGARWSHLAYQTFTEAQLPTGLATVVRFRAMESVRPVPGEVPVRGQSAGEASEAERALFFAAVSRLRRPPYVEALDLVPVRFDLDPVRRRWARAGFSRDRVLLVARENGRPLAAAVAECAQDALHLFGLLDCVRLYPLAPGGESAYRLLLGAARQWYRTRGKERFVCFFEAESFDAAGSIPGLTDLGAAHLMAYPRLLLPDFLEHLYVITAPRRRGH